MQNEPIDNDLKVDDIGLYFEKIHNKIFPNQISLKLSKRCLDENQNRKIELLGKEFREHIHDVEYCKKLIIGMPEFKKIYKPEEIKTKKNVVGTHRTSNWVNGLLHEKKNNQKYYVGLNLLGKNTYKKKGFHIFANNSYIIEKIEKNKNGVIYIVSDGMDKHFIHQNMMDMVFKLNYSITCHAVQGFSIDEKYTIFDINHPMITSKWLWVAITRNTNLENISIYMSKPNPIDYIGLDKIIKERIIGHYNSDSCRDIVGEYIDVSFIRNKLFKVKKCCLCRNVFDLNDGESWSIDRLNNNLSHVKDNCQIICRNCNIRKK